MFCIIKSISLVGFLSTEDNMLPGNMGLKDMAFALKWTKDEIKNFGGDPELITAFGFSAGAASVHYLCSVPKTKGKYFLILNSLSPRTSPEFSTRHSHTAEQSFLYYFVIFLH